MTWKTARVLCIGSLHFELLTFRQRRILQVTLEQQSRGSCTSDHDANRGGVDAIEVL